MTVTVSDGTNTGSTLSYTVTVTDVAPAITGSQSGSVAENGASGADVMTVAVTGDTPSLFSINGGNTDADSDGTGPFKINTAGLIEIDDADDVDDADDGTATAANG